MVLSELAALVEEFSWAGCGDAPPQRLSRDMGLVLTLPQFRRNMIKPFHY
jgi:hypothetical protein